MIPLMSRQTPYAAPTPVRRFDPLSHVLESLRLRWRVPGVAEMTAPWGVEFSRPSPELLREHLERRDLPPPPPGSPQPVRGAVFAILRGSCWLDVPADDVHVPLVGGDLVLITRPGPHLLRDDPRTPVRHVIELLSRDRIERQAGLAAGGGGAPTDFLHGLFSFDDQTDNPLLASLPPVIHIRGEQGRAVPWLADTISFLVHELSTRGPGSHAIISHLTHVLFVQAVRGHFLARPADGHGDWFAALSDPEIGVALGLLHEHPETPWTVEKLADHASMSRSTFAARFATIVGRTPMQYLAECRMRVARELLGSTTLGMKAIAKRAGYANESAFSNAFKRHVGVAPLGYRRERALTHSPVATPARDAPV